MKTLIIEKGKLAVPIFIVGVVTQKNGKCVRLKIIDGNCGFSWLWIMTDAQIDNFKKIIEAKYRRIYGQRK